MSSLDLKQAFYAATFPYLGLGKQIVKTANLDFNHIPPAVKSAANQWIQLSLRSSADFKNPYSNQPIDALENSVLGYPLAKIYLRLLNHSTLNEKFADLVAQLALDGLSDESLKRIGLTLMDVCNDLGVSVEPSQNRNGFYLVPLSTFLNTTKRKLTKRLIHLEVENGFVILSLNELRELLSDVCRQRLAESFHDSGFNESLFPLSFKEEARAIVAPFLAEQQKKIEKLSGPVQVKHFPPCMVDLSNRLTSGENLNHVSRFNLATFLLNVNMPLDSIVAIYSKAPNFDEQKTRYHLKSLQKDGKPYSVSSCESLRGHHLCIQNGALCPGITHPLQFYRQGRSVSNNFSTGGETK